MKLFRLRTLIRGLSFTSVLFIFQCAYGMPQDMGDDMLIEGKVVSESSGLPLKGIKVRVALSERYAITDSTGTFGFYTYWVDHLELNIEDTDSTSDGNYASKDTLLMNPDNSVFLNIALEEI
jgi:hypothetical protein